VSADNFSAPPSSVSPSAYPAGGSRLTATSGGAAKVFREFKWGLLTLFLLMVVVIGLVYDGGRKKEAQKPQATEETKNETAFGAATDGALPPLGEESLPPMAPLAPSTTGVPARGLEAERLAQARPSGAGAFSDSNLAPRAAPRIPNEPPMVRAPEALAQERLDALTTPPAAPSETAAAGSGTYTVKPGETLSGIAQKLFPGRVQAGIKALCEANKDQFKDPRTLRSGMNLKVPALAGAAAPAKVAAAQEPVPAKSAEGEKARDSKDAKVAKETKESKDAADGDVYVVQAGDTLERIARKVLKDGNRWRELYEWNRDVLSAPGLLRVGQKLRTHGAVHEAAAPEDKEQPKKPARKPHTVASEDKPVRLSAEKTEKAPGWMP